MLAISQTIRQNIVENGFLNLTDTFAINGAPFKDTSGLIQYPANIIGENGNVGFIENLRASGHSTDEILAEFERQLDFEGNYKMVFDHPFYVGIKELELLSRMIKISIEKGYKVESLKNICKHLR